MGYFRIEKIKVFFDILTNVFGIFFPTLIFLDTFNVELGCVNEKSIFLMNEN